MAAKDLKAKPGNVNLTLSARHLSVFSLGLIHLAELAPERLTAGQIVIFLHAGMGDLGGVPMTLSDINDVVGDGVGKSLRTTYQVFLDGNLSSNKNRVKGLHWLRSEIDPKDNRRKLLLLTDEGRKVMSEVLDRITT